MSKLLTKVFHFAVTLILFLPFSVSGKASPLCADLFYKEAPGSQKRDFVELYSENVPIKKYTENLLKIKAGDTISFDQDTQFTVKSVLGEGDTTIVFDIGQNKALRVPIYVNVLKGLDAETQSVKLLNDFLNSNLGLRAVGANVVKVFSEESRKSRFIVTEKIDVQFTLEDFLKKHVNQTAFLEDQLVLFAKSFWAVINLGDFFPRQIAWDGKKWILLDYGYAANYIESFREKRTIFDSYTVEGIYGNEEVVFANNELLERIRESILKERRNAEKKEWTLRDDGAGSDYEVGLLVNFPFSGTLREGTELYVNRESTYHAYLFDAFNIQKTNSYPSVKIIIEELIDKKKGMSVYKVRTANNKNALLIFKNKLSNHLELLDGRVLKNFKLKDFKLGSVLGSGFDYFLIEIK